MDEQIQTNRNHTLRIPKNTVDNSYSIFPCLSDLIIVLKTLDLRDSNICVFSLKGHFPLRGLRSRLSLTLSLSPHRHPSLYIRVPSSLFIRYNKQKTLSQSWVTPLVLPRFINHGRLPLYYPVFCLPHFIYCLLLCYFPDMDRILIR